MTALSLSFFSKHSKTSTIWPYLVSFFCSHWHSSFFYAFITCLFLNLCLCLLYEFIFPESMRRISLKLKILPYFPKIRMLQTLGKQSFQCSNLFLFLILFSFVLSGKTNRLLIVTSICSFHCHRQIRYIKRRPF